MSLLNKLTNGSGYAILPIDDMQSFGKLRDLFLQKINSDSNQQDIELVRKKLARLSKLEINKVMVNLLGFEEASELMAKSCRSVIHELCGDDIFLQRRANIIFNLPGENQRRQWPHYELMSGISPYTFAIWAPLHDVIDDGGVYYLEEAKSIDIMKIEESQGLVNGPTMFNMVHDEKAAKLKYGELIVFNPFVLHGNSDFESKLARIACSIRFQSIQDPLMQKNTDFLKFYRFH
jgi:sporadic carbohydrate cluster 2OG-Fe(II) oxygenase